MMETEERNRTSEKTEYYISSYCIGCGRCADACPQKCIGTTAVPFVIEQERCLHCGICYGTCPRGAVEKRIRNSNKEE